MNEVKKQGKNKVKRYQRSKKNKVKTRQKGTNKVKMRYTTSFLALQWFKFIHKTSPSTFNEGAGQTWTWQRQHGILTESPSPF